MRPCVPLEPLPVYFYTWGRNNDNTRKTDSKKLIVLSKTDHEDRCVVQWLLRYGWSPAYLPTYLPTRKLSWVTGHNKNLFDLNKVIHSSWWQRNCASLAGSQPKKKHPLLVASTGHKPNRILWENGGGCISTITRQQYSHGATPHIAIQQQYDPLQHCTARLDQLSQLYAVTYNPYGLALLFDSCLPAHG